MTFRHRAGVRPYTSPRGLAESCVFGKQSLGPFRCGPPALPGRAGSRWGRPFSLSYGTIMPSSLTMVAPIASECSSYPPVSVLVRAAWALPRDFSRRHGIRDFAIGLVSRLGICGDRISWAPPYALSRGRPEPRSRILPRRPIGRSAPAPARECLPVVHRLRLAASP